MSGSYRVRGVWYHCPSSDLLRSQESDADITKPAVVTPCLANKIRRALVRLHVGDRLDSKEIQEILGMMALTPFVSAEDLKGQCAETESLQALHSLGYRVSPRGTVHQVDKKEDKYASDAA